MHDVIGIQGSWYFYAVVHCKLVGAYQRVGEIDLLRFLGHCHLHAECEDSLSPSFLFIQLFWYLAFRQFFKDFLFPFIIHVLLTAFLVRFI